MRKIFLPLLMLFFVSLIFTACDQVDLTPAPQVEVIHFSPLALYVGIVPETTFVQIDTLTVDTVVDYVMTPVEIDSIDFKVWNYVDAKITEMSYGFRSVKTNDIVDSGLTQGLGILLSGGDDT